MKMVPKLVESLKYAIGGGTESLQVFKDSVVDENV